LILSHGSFSQTINHQYNALDQNTVIKDGMYTYRFDYDERGNVRTFTTGNGAGSTFTYDERGLVESVSVGTADGKEILSETYRYDENGNRTKVVKTKDGQSTTTNADYNAANQLVRFGGETITYDANGNRLEDGQYRYEWNAATSSSPSQEKEKARRLSHTNMMKTAAASKRM
jgi:YD repeat-containing protein